MADGAPTVLLVEDDASLRLVAGRALEQAGFSPVAAASLDEARSLARRQAPAAVVTDLKLPDGSGFELVGAVPEDRPAPVILITAYADLDAAVQAYAAGAFDYLPKPFDLDELVSLVRRALADREHGDGGPRPGEPRLLGRSPAMQPVFRAIGRLAGSGVPVLITGPTGSGKELVARALHRHGPRAGQPFVAVNVAAIPRELLEAELFGHEKGSFTGAHERRQGRFEQAAGGTLFLDEIGDMPAGLQTRLLRVLSEGEFYRVGGTRPIHASTRVITATHQDLEKRVRTGAFREDLLHRLDVVHIAVPPLAERPEDIGDLAAHFLQRAALESGVPTKRLHPSALAWLRRRAWPGNVRELGNLCRRLTALTPGPVIYPDDLPGDAQRGTGDAERELDSAVDRWFAANRDGRGGELWREAMARLERRLIDLALEATGGNRSKAAELLGIGRNTLSRKAGGGGD